MGAVVFVVCHRHYSFSTHLHKDRMGTSNNDPDCPHSLTSLPLPCAPVGVVNTTINRIFEDAFLLKAISGEVGGVVQSAAQLALQAHQKEQQEEEQRRQKRALEHKEELQETQQQQQQTQAQAQAPQSQPDQDVSGQQQQQGQQQQAGVQEAAKPPPPPPRQPARQQPPPPPGAGRLTASLPSAKSRVPPRPPSARAAAAGAGAAATGAGRLTAGAPPKAVPRQAQKAPPNRPAAQPPGGPLAAAAAAEMERQPGGGGRARSSGMLSMFKRDKKDTLGLDAQHSTQQFDAPTQPPGKPPPPKLQPPTAVNERSTGQLSPSLADKAPSIVTRPVQATAATINNIVTIGGLLGGSKEDPDARQRAMDEGEVPPAGVLRHEVACSLLGVVSTQAPARAARELCREVRCRQQMLLRGGGCPALYAL